MKTIVVEGWRFIAHSYAMVNQHQCLELVRRPELRLYHRDVPLYWPTWKQARGLWNPAQESALRAIPAPPADLRPDALLRMGFPHFFHNDPAARRTFVWGTTEFKLVEDASIAVRKPAREVLPATEADLIAPSAWAAAGFLGSGAPPHKVHTVPCGVDPVTFRPASPVQRTALRKSLGWDGRFVVLNVSAMTANKGIDLLLKAAAAVAQSVPSLLVALKGSDALYQSDSLMSRTLGSLTPDEAERVGPRLAYMGDVLSTQEIARLYQAADAYVCPYRVEGFNLPALEAMACGLPLVCTRGGPTDGFVSDQFALLVDSREELEGADKHVLAPDLDHLTEQVRRVATDAAWRENAGPAGSRHAHQRFTWKHAVDRLLEVLFAP